MDRMRIREEIEIEASRRWRQIVAEIETTPNVYLRRLAARRDKARPAS